MCWGLVTAVLDDSDTDSHQVKRHNLLKNPYLYVSVLFCCLEHQMHKGFVVQISQNVSQPSRRVTLPWMPLITDALMILKILYVLLSLDTVQSAPYNSRLRVNNCSFRTTDSANCFSYPAAIRQP